MDIKKYYEKYVYRKQTILTNVEFNVKKEF